MDVNMCLSTYEREGRPTSLFANVVWYLHKDVNSLPYQLVETITIGVLSGAYLHLHGSSKQHIPALSPSMTYISV